MTKRKLKPGGDVGVLRLDSRCRWRRTSPWDEFARELLTAQGSALENGAGNFYVIHHDPREAAETASMTFLGMSINCAKCHNHPMEKWTNNDYYGFANLFSRVRLKNGGADGDNVVFSDR